MDVGNQGSTNDFAQVCRAGSADGFCMESTMPELRSSKLQELQGSNSEATCANVFEQGNLQLDKGTVHQVPTNFAQVLQSS